MPVNIKTPAQWAELLGKTDASNCSAEIAAAGFILNQLRGYRPTRKASLKSDTEILAAALEGYALLLQRHGLILDDPEKQK